MSMKKMLLTTHWSPEEAYDTLEFLTELCQVIRVNYAEELDEYHRQTCIEQQYERLKSEEDIIPF